MGGRRGSPTRGGLGGGGGRRRSDGGEPLGKLGDRMLGAVNARVTTELVGKLHGLNEPRGWAALAGVVFEAAEDDTAAASLVERAASALGELVRVVSVKLSIDQPIVLAGGLL